MFEVKNLNSWKKIIIEIICFDIYVVFPGSNGIENPLIRIATSQNLAPKPLLSRGTEISSGIGKRMHF